MICHSETTAAAKTINQGKSGATFPFDLLNANLIENAVGIRALDAVHSGAAAQGCRSRGEGGTLPLPSFFGRSVNPILITGQIMPTILLLSSLSEFSDLPTALVGSKAPELTFQNFKYMQVCTYFNDRFDLENAFENFENC